MIALQVVLYLALGLLTVLVSVRWLGPADDMDGGVLYAAIFLVWPFVWFVAAFASFCWCMARFSEWFAPNDDG